MIRNNKLSYASVEREWYLFDISQTSLSSLVTSVLVTLISYQVASILFTITLGMKKRHETKLKNFGIVLLTRYLSSPLAVLNSILRVDWLTRLYYRGDIPRDTHISRDPASVHVRTASVLFLLVIAPPMIDTMLVALSLSRTNELTFEEAGFRGVLLGVDRGLNVVETIPYVSLCNLAKFEERPEDLVRVAFQLCESPSLPEDAPENVTGVEISLENQVQVVVRVILQGYVLLSQKYAQVNGNDVEMHVMAAVTNRSVAPLVDIALDGFAKHCGERNTLGPLPPKQNDVFGTNKVLLASVRVACGNVTISEEERRTHATQIVESLKEKVTFIEAESTLVRNASDLGSNFVENKNDVLLQRTERNSSMFMLIVVAVILLLVRATLGTIFANDVEKGLEVLILDRLGCGERHTTMWKDVERVRFRKKYQYGERCQLGLELEETAEVESFRGGVVGEVR
ncbi:hypothetical protein BWQ96_05044 [Gracilariopsis chorda]|uniref:Uncharacterized protein n=1 Tax=Gracilariopsis chorda TaxID=448386 RepID=A0A2V3ISX8_9FLOR|nr:hypothetical protein BWQ96_05044 [Gracilariopsis chorda]|eukprot:PXF45214.1 hypothetical protein BWQ96_05044 [Gracilariopsis chorda]